MRQAMAFYSILLLGILQTTDGFLLQEFRQGISSPASNSAAISLAVSRDPNDSSGGSIGNNDDGKDDTENNQPQDIMAVVRSLQDSYYKTESPTPACTFALEGGGEVHNLPILMWPWNELPGRSNVLHVHEGTYTHMLETIVRSNPPVWYMGHIFRDGKDRQLHSWQDVAKDEIVLGTLLRITDYRRMMDGRMLVLVQALERFVVKKIIVQTPYAVAHIQILPDDEEDEQAGNSRTTAVLESFQKWHRYEFEQTMLPLPLSNKDESNQSKKSTNGENAEDSDNDVEVSEYLEDSQIVGSALAQVLPYSPFSSIVDVERLKDEKVPLIHDPENLEGSTQADLKHELFERDILHDPPFVEPKLLEKPIEIIEYELWIYLDKYLKQTKRAVSPILLGLLPPNEKWPVNFALEKIVTAIQEQDTYAHKCIRVSPHYPAHRRQKRLSFSAAAVLEQDEQQAKAWRLQMLQASSTKARLAYILQCVRHRVEKNEGEFE